ELFAGVHRLTVGHSYYSAAAFAHSLEHEKIAQRLRHTQSTCDRGCAFPEFAEFGVLLECAKDGLTAFGLDRYHFGTLRSDPAKLFEFCKCFPHPDHSNAAAC